MSIPLLLAVETFVSQPGYARSTRETYRVSLQRLARSLGEDTPVAELDGDKLTQWFEETYGPSRRRRRTRSVRQFGQPAVLAGPLRVSFHACLAR